MMNLPGLTKHVKTELNTDIFVTYDLDNQSHTRSRIGLPIPCSSSLPRRQNLQVESQYTKFLLRLTSTRSYRFVTSRKFAELGHMLDN